MEKTDEKPVSQEQLSKALNSIYRRTRKDTEQLVKDQLVDIRERINDNTADIRKHDERLRTIETVVLPLTETVNNIKEDVTEMKTDIKEGFKELKLDFKEYKEEIKEDVKEISDEVDCLSEKQSDHEKRISNAETGRGLIGFLKSTEGIVVSIITVSGPAIVAIINLIGKH